MMIFLVQFCHSNPLIGHLRLNYVIMSIYVLFYNFFLKWDGDMG